MKNWKSTMFEFLIDDSWYIDLRYHQKLDCYSNVKNSFIIILVMQEELTSYAEGY